MTPQRSFSRFGRPGQSARRPLTKTAVHAARWGVIDARKAVCLFVLASTLGFVAPQVAAACSIGQGSVTLHPGSDVEVPANAVVLVEVGAYAYIGPRVVSLPMRLGTDAELPVLARYGEGPARDRLIVYEAPTSTNAFEFDGAVVRLSRSDRLDVEAPLAPAMPELVLIDFEDDDDSCQGPTDVLGELSLPPDAAAFVLYEGDRVVAAGLAGDTRVRESISPGDYCYRVVAIDAAGNESAPSSSQCVTAEAGGCTCVAAGRGSNGSTLVLLGLVWGIGALGLRRRA